MDARAFACKTIRDTVGGLNLSVWCNKGYSMSVIAERDAILDMWIFSSKNWPQNQVFEWS